MRGHIQKRGNKYSFILTLGNDPRTGNKFRNVCQDSRQHDAGKAINKMIADIE